jgi:shikimate kinase
LAFVVFVCRLSLMVDLMPHFPQVIILLGPCGAGKTTVCRLLAERIGARFLDLEGFGLERYPTYDLYRANREQLYRDFTAFVEVSIADTQRPVVFEEVGLSPLSQQLIARMQQGYRAVLIALLASEETCVERVAARGIAANFPKSPELVRRIHAEFLEQAYPRYTFACEIQNDQPSDEALMAAIEECAEQLMRVE